MKLIMPGMSGFDAAKEFRKLEAEFGLNSDARHFICGITAEITDGKFETSSNRYSSYETMRWNRYWPSSSKTNWYQWNRRTAENE